jgi:CRISP-associated protein Cas1
LKLDGYGFDPYLGFYHTVTYGRPSLALDLLEEYRHSLVDRLAFNLFNLNIMSAEDFYPVPEGGIYLNDSGKKKFFTHYERMMGQYKSATDTADKQPGFRAVFQKRIQELARKVRLSEESVVSSGLAEEDFDLISL